MSGLDYFLGISATADVPGGYTPAITDKSLVRYIIFDENISSRGVSILSQLKAEEQEKESTTGFGNKSILEAKEDIKTCGIEYQVAITDVYNPSTNKWEPIIHNGNLPDFNNITRIEYIPFSLCLKGMRQLGMKYLSNMFKMAVEDGTKAIRIGYQPFFPLEMKDLDKEKERKDQETKIISAYAAIDSEMAITGIKRAAARRFIMHKLNADGYPNYYEPEIGMYAHAQYKINKGQYFNLDAFGYNPNLPTKNKEEVFVLGHQCVLATDESKALANSIKAQYEQRRAEKLKEKENVEEIDINAVEEDLF